MIICNLNEGRKINHVYIASEESSNWLGRIVIVLQYNGGKRYDGRCFVLKRFTASFTLCEKGNLTH